MEVLFSGLEWNPGFHKVEETRDPPPEREMAVGIRLWWYVFFGLGFAIILCSARNTVLLVQPAGDDGVGMVMTEGRRYLKTNIDDYGEPSASHEHDPRNKIGSGSGSGGGGRKN
ncbi:PREDICTED: uncharacterized protein LOC104602579 [Nelumbo nucifera]|uniref:Uncharacterized protein n=2 Tax=Nelumbo nucifera TaxID=4432 RepID=A0A822Y9V4_NELNU|nr:PREDICTED: uncharacterized protein LOC104602579 [Nelumbo nucifera]DAD28039.1 TPA_asm: hypothetical protein HUJ06_029507 [Nelumbo nucifera]